MEDIFHPEPLDHVFIRWLFPPLLSLLFLLLAEISAIDTHSQMWSVMHVLSYFSFLHSTYSKPSKPTTHRLRVTDIHHITTAAVAALLLLFVHVMREREEGGDETSCDEQQNPSLLLHLPLLILLSSLFAERSEQVCARLRGKSGRAPSLPLNRLRRERTQNRSSINYSLSEIFISHSHSLSPGFYNPRHIPALVMEIPLVSLTCFELILLILSTRTCSAHIHQDGKKTSVYLLFFPLCCLHCRDLSLCSPVRLYSTFNWISFPYRHIFPFCLISIFI